MSHKKGTEPHLNT